MSYYDEYREAAQQRGHKKPGPGADQTNGTSSGCMVVAPVPAAALVAAVLLLRRSRR